MCDKGIDKKHLEDFMEKVESILGYSRSHWFVQLQNKDVVLNL